MSGEMTSLARLVARHRAHNDMQEQQLRKRNLIGLVSEALTTEELNSALREWQESMGQIRRGLRRACGMEES